MASFFNAKGETQQLPLDVSIYRLAAAAGMTVPQYININYQTDPKKYGASTFNQLLESEGIFVKPNKEYGVRPSTMDAIINGNMQAGGVNVKEGVPTSRILFPAVMLQAIEDKLVANLAITANAFESMIAIDEAVNGERYEQPVINFANAEKGRSQGIAQLAQPPAMLTITTSDKAYKIPTFAIGLEVSDQALKATTIDFVALSLARQAAVERNERSQGYVLQLLNGDIDNGDGTLASKGLVDNSSTFDAAATGGAITQTAWIKYLSKNGTKRTITHLVTDLATAMKVENRTGKPTINTDDPNSTRIDTGFSIMNPTWAKNPKIFLTDDPAWPANTLMGLDAAWAIRRVRNLSADFNGTESWVLRRSTTLRIDFGEHVNRLYDEAFGVMVLA